MLENHVPSLELCKKWKELGGRQDTEFYWHHGESLASYPEGSICAAPLVSEMMEWEKDDLVEVYFSINRWIVRWVKDKFSDEDSLPNALMQMCISRKEEEGGCHKK